MEILIRLKDIIDPEILGDEALRTLTGPWSLWGGALLGFLLGFVLQKGKMAKYDTVSGLFRFQDFTFFRVGTTLLISATILIHLFYSLGFIELYPPRTIPVANLLGGLLFGSGLAIAGYCPGISAAALGEGDLSAIPGLIGMMTGAAVYGSFWYGSWADNILSYIDLNNIAAADIYIHWPIIIVLVLMYFMFLLGITFMDWFIVTFFTLVGWGDKLDKVIETRKRIKTEAKEKTRLISKRRGILRAKRWYPVPAGIAFAFLELFSFLLSNRPLGTIRGISELDSIILYLASPNYVESTDFWFYLYPPYLSWGIIFLVFITIGSFISSILSGKFKFIMVPKMWRDSMGPSLKKRGFWAFVGGVLVGFGGMMAGGCTLMLISGVSQLAPGGFIFMMSLYVGAINTTWIFYNIKTLTFKRA